MAVEGFPILDSVSTTISSGANAFPTNITFDTDSDFNVTAGATLSLVYNGANNLWIELSRSIGV